MSIATPAPKVFISYAHEDEAHRETLGKHLSALEREGLINIWHDRMITAGREWAGAIDAALQEAGVVLLLISADFLDSDYCNDVELTEAIRMHDAEQARVVPVILRSCDWEHSKFSRFNALPPDGLPVVEAEHPDQRFKLVAKGLRAIVAELRGAGAADHEATPQDTASSPPSTVAMQPKPRKLTLGKISLLGVIEIGPFELPLPGPRSLATGLIAVMLLLAVMGAGAHFMILRGPLDEARNQMRMARYDNALKELAEIPAWLSEWPGVASLRDKAALGAAFNDEKPNWELLGSKLRRLREQSPSDADLMVIDATYNLRREENYEKARALAKAATQADPQNAEAWFLLGLDRDLAGESGGAEEHYRKAATAAPDSPQYRSNLARLLLDDGQFDKAIGEYRKVRQFPLARLEQALGHWAKGEFDNALAAQRDALRMLGDAALMDSYFNRRMWQFPLPVVQLPKVEDRHCYASIEEAATRRLAGDAAVAFPPTVCGDPPVEIAKLVADDLCRFVDGPQPEFADRAGALRLALRLPAACRGSLP